MNHILPQAQELLSTLKQLMPTIYQQETLESVLGLFLKGQGKGVPREKTCTKLDRLPSDKGLGAIVFLFSRTKFPYTST